MMNMIASATESTEVGSVVGTVKWFDREKGYGFICVPGMPEDILLHINVLLQFGKSTTTAGAIVSCEVSVEAGRFRVAKINLIEAVEEGALSEQPVLRFHPARTKWFSKSKGYGFAVAYGTTEDIFVGQEALRLSGLGYLTIGEAISVAIERRGDSLVAIQVAPWQ